MLGCFGSGNQAAVWRFALAAFGAGRTTRSGPIPAIHGVVRWRIVDLCQWIFEEFQVVVAQQTLSRAPPAANVIEFRPPRRRPAPPAKLTIQEADQISRGAWKAAVRAFWDEPANWRTSKKGHAYIVIDECGACVVVKHNDERGGYWTWEIRWRDGRETNVSRWIYVNEEGAFVAALDAVLALA